MSLFREYVNPYLGELIEYLHLDKSYTKGEGLYLYDSDSNPYLDFIAAYGSLPFGFNDPDIWRAIGDVHANMEPSFVQPSDLVAAGELAKLLVSLAPEGIRYATFANSGTEAVEAALKMARSSTKRMGIVSTLNSFHGKTMGALSATGKASYQKPFGAPIPGFESVPFGSLEALREVLVRRSGDIAAFIVEPIQGEGGVVIPPDGYLKAAYELCHEHGVLFILDEIQAGLGRTGELFAVACEGFTPDIILLAKALGGGIVPIGACLSTEAAYNEDFGTKHSSTFAGNTLACRVGLASVRKLANPELLSNVRARGEQLLSGLVAIQKKYPRVIREVRGKGLLIGIDFQTDLQKWPLGFLSIMTDQDVLTPIIASYLLNVEGLRVAPTLNGTSVIRIEPALIVSAEQCEFALRALERVARLLDRGNAAAFVGHLIGRMDDEVLGATNYSAPRQRPEPPGPSDGRFAFLVHPLDLRNWREFDDSLEVFTDEDIAKVADLFGSVVDPFVISDARIVSRTGKSAYGQFIIIPMVTADLVRLPREEAIAILTKGIDLAKAHGARIVGLGAYTSVISKGGRDLVGQGMPLTTGNCFTVAAAMEATLEASSRLGVALEETTACVVGASGSIGRALGILLGERVNRLVLVGNPKTPESSRRRLLSVVSDLCAHLAALDGHTSDTFAQSRIEWLKAQPGYPALATKEGFDAFAAELEARGEFVKVTSDLAAALKEADIVVTATSSVTALVEPHMLKAGAVVCDLSVPADVSEDVRDERPDVMVLEGGVISLPGHADLGWDFGFDKGEAYACMSETIMLAMDERYEDVGLGLDLPIATVLAMRDGAKRHGLSLAGFKSFGRPLPQEAWDRVREARLKASVRE